MDSSGGKTPGDGAKGGGEGKMRMGFKKKFLVDYLEDVGGGGEAPGSSGGKDTGSSVVNEPVRAAVSERRGSDDKLDMANCIDRLVHSEINKPSLDDQAALAAAEEARRANSFFFDRRNNQAAAVSSVKPYPQLPQQLDQQITAAATAAIEAAADKQLLQDRNIESYYSKASPSSRQQVTSAESRSYYPIDTQPAQSHDRVRATPESRGSIDPRVAYEPPMQHSPRVPTSYPTPEGPQQGWARQISPGSREAAPSGYQRPTEYVARGPRGEPVYVIDDNESSRHHLAVGSYQTDGRQIQHPGYPHRPGPGPVRSSGGQISPHLLAAAESAAIQNRVSARREFPPGKGDYPMEISAADRAARQYRSNATPSSAQGYPPSAQEQYESTARRMNNEVERRPLGGRTEYELDRHSGAQFQDMAHSMKQQQQQPPRQVAYDRRIDPRYAPRPTGNPSQGKVPMATYPGERPGDVVVAPSQSQKSLHDVYDGRSTVAAMLSAPNLPFPHQSQQRHQQYYRPAEPGHDNRDAARRMQQDAQMRAGSYRGSIITGSSGNLRTAGSPPKSYIAEPPSLIELVEPSVQPRPSGLHNLANIATEKWLLPGQRGEAAPPGSRYYEGEGHEGKSQGGYPFSSPRDSRSREVEVSEGLRRADMRYRNSDEASAAALDLTVKPSSMGLPPQRYMSRITPHGEPGRVYDWAGGEVRHGVSPKGLTSPRAPGPADLEHLSEERRREYDARQRANWMLTHAAQQQQPPPQGGVRQQPPPDRQQPPPDWASPTGHDDRLRLMEPSKTPVYEHGQHRARLMAALSTQGPGDASRGYPPPPQRGYADSRLMENPSRGSRHSEEDMGSTQLIDSNAPPMKKVKIVDVPIETRPQKDLPYYPADSGSGHPRSQHVSPGHSQHSPVLDKDPQNASYNSPAAATRVSIMALLGTCAPNDILDVECKYCWTKYGSLRSFRIHFAKVHGLEPTPDNFIVHTISEAKLAMSGTSTVSSKSDLDSSNGRQSDDYYGSAHHGSKIDLPPSLSREEHGGHTPGYEASPRLGGKGDVGVRPTSVSGGGKQIAEVYPMLSSRVEPPLEAGGRVKRDELGVEEVRAKEEERGGKKSPQCVRCRVRGDSRGSVDEGGKRLDDGPTDTHCSTCMEGFRDISDWRVHVSSMHMMRSCACKTCNIGFTHAGALHKHLNSVHGVGDSSGIIAGRVEVEYRCLFCPRSFNDEDVLYRHTAEHEKEYTARRLGIGRGVSSHIECAVPDTTCPEDQKPSTSGGPGGDNRGTARDHSPSARSPHSEESDDKSSYRFHPSEAMGHRGDDRYGNREERKKINDRVNDVIEQVLTSSSRHGDADMLERYRGVIGEGRGRVEGDDGGKGVPSRSDSVRRFIENLVVQEMKRPTASGPAPTVQAPPITCQSSMSGWSKTVPSLLDAMPNVRHRSSTISLPASSGEYPGYTTQLLQAARSSRVPQAPPAGRREGGICVERDVAQSNALALLRLSTTGQQDRNRSPGQGENSSGARKREPKSRPLFRDLVSIMNQEVENSIRGYSMIPGMENKSDRKSPAVSGSSPTSVGSAPRQRCVRDVCDEIIAQSFRDETSSASSSPTARRSSPGIPSMASLFGGARKYSTSSGSPARSEEDAASLSGKRDAQKDASEGSSSSSGMPAGRGALTLKELMENPEMVKSYKLAGLGVGSPAGGQERPARTGTAPVRRRSEEGCSLSQFFGGGSANTFERRRNQTFSVTRSGDSKAVMGKPCDNSTKSTSGSSRLEVLAAEARKRVLEMEGLKLRDVKVTDDVKVEQTEDLVVKSEAKSDEGNTSDCKVHAGSTDIPSSNQEVKKISESELKSSEEKTASDIKIKSNPVIALIDPKSGLIKQEEPVLDDISQCSDDDDDDYDDDDVGRSTSRKRRLVIDETRSASIDEPSVKSAKIEEQDDSVEKSSAEQETGDQNKDEKAS